MGIAVFTSLGIPLNLAEPAYLEHVSSVFSFSLRVCERNWPLCIGPLRFLNSSSYWSSRTIQSFFCLDQVKRFILASGSVPDQGTISFSSLYNPPHRGESISSPDPSTLSDHLTTIILDVSPSGAWLLILAPSGAESSVCIDSCFSSSENKPWTDWLPLGDNHSSEYLPSCPWSWNSPSIRFGSSHCLLIESLQQRSVKIPSQHNLLVDNINYSLMHISRSLNARIQGY